MDATLIQTGPVTPAAIAARPATNQDTTQKNETSGDTTSDGSQSSFADVLRQSSQAQPSRSPDRVASKTDPTASTSTSDNAGADIPKDGTSMVPGVVIAGPGASIQGSPYIPISVPVVLQDRSEGTKGVSSSVLSELNGILLTRGNAKKSTGSTSEGPKAAPSDDVSTQVVASSSQLQVIAPVTVTKEPDQVQTGVEPGAVKSGPGTGPATVSKAAAPSARSAAASRSTPDESLPTSGLLAEGNLPDAGAAPLVAHADVAVAVASHPSNMIDATVANLNTGTSLAAPAIHSPQQIQASATTSATGASSLYTVIPPSDTGSASGLEHTTLVATPNVIEVGLSSGSHGWVRVRAEMSTSGDVTASVRAASETAYESLHKELPSISAYLASESVGVSSLSVQHASPSLSATPGFGGSGLADTGSDAAGSQTGGRGSAPTADSSTLAASDDGNASFDLNMVGVLPVAAYRGASGGWLSVLA